MSKFDIYKNSITIDELCGYHDDEDFVETEKFKLEIIKRVDSLIYPAYFDVYDKPYRFNRKGNEIVTRDYWRQKIDIFEAVAYGCQIKEKEYIKLKRHYQHIARKRKLKQSQSS